MPKPKTPTTRTILLAVSLAAACESSEPEGTGTSPNLFCRALCDVVARCESLDEQRDCYSDCVADRPGLINISPEGATVFSDCIRQLSCMELHSDEAFDACWDDAATRVEITPHTRSFCQTFASAAFECGYSQSTEECEGAFGMWAGAVLDRLASCTEILDCEARDACIAEVYDSL